MAEPVSGVDARSEGAGRSFADLAYEMGKPFLSGLPYQDHGWTTGSVENLWMCVYCGRTTEHPGVGGQWCRRYGRVSS